MWIDSEIISAFLLSVFLQIDKDKILSRQWESWDDEEFPRMNVCTLVRKGEITSPSSCVFLVLNQNSSECCPPITWNVCEKQTFLAPSGLSINPCVEGEKERRGESGVRNESVTETFSWSSSGSSALRLCSESLRDDLRNYNVLTFYELYTSIIRINSHVLHIYNLYRKYNIFLFFFNLLNSAQG